MIRMSFTRRASLGKSKKKGRPRLPAEERLSIQHGIRFTHKEYRKLAEVAKAQGITVPSLIRNRVRSMIERNKWGVVVK